MVVSCSNDSTCEVYDVFDGEEEEFWIQAVRADLPPGSLRPVDPYPSRTGGMDGTRKVDTVGSQCLAQHIPRSW